MRQSLELLGEREEDMKRYGNRFLGVVNAN